MYFRSVLFVGVLLLVVPTSLSAHSTMQKFAEGKYLLNLSSAPLVPTAGQEQQNILALSDVSTDSLITAPSVFDVTIEKNGVEIVTFTDMVATGGLLQFNVTYPEAGLYEMFVTFHLPRETHEYAPEDYWIQVIPKAAAPSSWWPGFLLIVGCCIGYGLARSRQRFTSPVS